MAASAISLLLEAADGAEEDHRAVERFEIAAIATEGALLTADHANWHRKEVEAPLRRGISGVALPLAIHAYQAATGRRSRLASTVAAASTLAGGLMLRAAILLGSNQSAQRPQDYSRNSLLPPR